MIREITARTRTYVATNGGHFGNVYTFCIFALSRNFLIRKKAREIMMTVYQITILTYGAENWVFNEGQEKRLQTTEMKYLRRILKVRRVDRKRNNIRQELNIKPLK